MGAGWGDYKRGWMGRTIRGAGWGLDGETMDGGWMGRL